MDVPGTPLGVFDLVWAAGSEVVFYFLSRTKHMIANKYIGALTIKAKLSTGTRSPLTSLLIAIKNNAILAPQNKHQEDIRGILSPTKNIGSVKSGPNITINQDVNGSFWRNINIDKVPK
jgi:hypothetical protein